MAPVCLPLGDPDSHWSRFCPSWPAAIIFCTLFGLTMVVHVVQAWCYKKSFMWVLIMGAVWEFIAAATRLASIANPTDKSLYSVSFVFLVLAPLWINAFDYIVLGRLIWYYIPERQLAGIKATRLAVYFVIMDITSFVVQLSGALMTTSDDDQQTINGLHVYTAGVSLQQCVILVFFCLGILFLRRFQNLETDKDKKKGTILVTLLFVNLVLLSWRVIFRIIEFSAGSKSDLSRTIGGNEWFVYVFDVGPMFFAIATYHFYHPGRVLHGPDSEYPKMSKEEKAMKKQQKREAKDEKGRQNNGGDLSAEANSMSITFKREC